MPWQLKTPIDVGGLDSNDYDQIRITRLTHDSVRSMILVDLEYGRTVDGEWVPGHTPKDTATGVVITGDDYAAVASHVSNDGERTYEAVRRGLYEWLSASGHIAPGSVVG